MSAQRCGLCGKDPAEGFASVNGVRFCHGDDDDTTCYMEDTWRTSRSVPARWLGHDDLPAILFPGVKAREGTE